MATTITFAGGGSVRVSESPADVTSALNEASQSDESAVQLTVASNSNPTWINPAQVTSYVES
jgi:hypothetical protein